MNYKNLANWYTYRAQKEEGELQDVEHIKRLSSEHLKIKRCSVYMNLVSNTGIKTDPAKDKQMTKVNVKFSILCSKHS